MQTSRFSPSFDPLQAYSAARNGEAIRYNHERTEELIDQIPVEFSGKVVLDVACGHANPFFSERLRAAQHVIGLDGNAQEVDRNQTIQEGFVGDIHAIPLHSNSVDIVVSVDTIEHSTQPGQFLAECQRVVKAGGEVVLTTPNLLGYKNLFARYCGKVIFDAMWKIFHNRKLDYDTCYRCNTRTTFERLATSAGLKLVQLEYIPDISWFFARFPFAFAAADAYNLVVGALGLKNLWGYMVVRLVKPVAPSAVPLASA